MASSNEELLKKTKEAVNGTNEKVLTKATASIRRRRRQAMEGTGEAVEIRFLRRAYYSR